MKYFWFSFIIVSIFSLSVCYAQNGSEKEKVDAVASQFLDSAAKQVVAASDIIAAESLDSAKAGYLSLALKFDSTGKSNAKMILPAKKIKSMTSAEVWDYMKKLSAKMKKLDMEIKWNIVNTEIKNNTAFVTYDVKNRPQKVMELKKENNKWKVVLSFASIF